MVINVGLNEQSYDIIVERGALSRAKEYLNLNRKVLIVTDSGVPSEYSNIVAGLCLDSYIYVIDEGEASKNIENYEKILGCLIKNEFTRTDCIVAVGGGVVGDLAGFVASSYMRGIDFYNIPTTFLSCVDSSIGGKVAIDFEGYKNIVGAFYQPKRVLIDPDTIKTLDKRQLSSGIAESIKMAATSDKELFELLENTSDFEKDMQTIIEESLLIKKNVVEKDPKEKGLRRVLNFGHTIGHAIESYESLGSFLHGECVSLGMMYMCSKDVKERLEKVLEKYNLPTKFDGDFDSLISYIKHDKKASGGKINIVVCKEIGSFEFVSIEISKLKDYIKEGTL